MAGEITSLPAASTPLDSTDLIEVVQDVGGTPTNAKVAVSDLPSASIDPPDRVAVTKNAQSVPTGVTTAIVFDTEVTDPSGLITTPSTDITLTSGIWVVSATAVFAANATGIRFASISGLSAVAAMQLNAITSAMYFTMSGLAIVSTTQVVTLRTYHTKGSALDIDGHLSAARIGDY